MGVRALGRVARGGDGVRGVIFGTGRVVGWGGRGGNDGRSIMKSGKSDGHSGGTGQGAGVGTGRRVFFLIGLVAEMTGGEGAGVKAGSDAKAPSSQQGQGPSPPYRQGYSVKLPNRGILALFCEFCVSVLV